MNDNITKIWIDQDWYIPVDDQGYCAGVCAEGTLGVVIQILMDGTDGKSRQALKIPRLLGDTFRENLYIQDIMESEINSVGNMWQQQANIAGVLPATPSGRGVLASPIQTASGKYGAEEWNGGIIFIRFEVGKKPRFCLVKITDEGDDVQFLPENLEEKPITSKAEFDLVRTHASDSYAWQATVTVSEPHLAAGGMENSGNTIESLSSSTGRDLANRVWFTSLPSMLYTWADGTLQEALGLKKLFSYSNEEDDVKDITSNAKGYLTEEQEQEKKKIEERKERAARRLVLKTALNLTKQIATGVQSLHQMGILHSDIRPANVAFAGTSQSPNSYYLIDYGGFSKSDTPAPHANATNSCATIFGPIINGERTSPFYSPERRSGHEREDGDSAILFTHNPASDEIDLLIGWRASLLDDDGLSVKSTVIEFLNDDDFQDRKDEKLADNQVSCGDMIQIREYIFEVNSVHKTEYGELFRCKRPYWKVFNGRVVVLHYGEDDENPKWMPISRYIELPKWSAASDIYSVGAMFLYLLSSLVGETRYENDTPINDREFATMMAHMEAVPYFRAIWPEINNWVEQCEIELNKGHNLYATSSNKSDEELVDDESLLGLAKRYQQMLCYTVPHIDKIANYVNNSAIFVLLIHFALGCIHRRNDLKTVETTHLDEQVSLLPKMPFCRSRLDDLPDNSNEQSEVAVVGVVERIGGLIEHLSDIRFDPFAFSHEITIKGFDPTPEGLVKQNLYNFQRVVEENSEKLRAHFDRGIHFPGDRAFACGIADTVKVAADEVVLSGDKKEEVSAECKSKDKSIKTEDKKVVQESTREKDIEHNKAEQID